MKTVPDVKGCKSARALLLLLHSQLLILMLPTESSGEIRVNTKSCKLTSVLLFQLLSLNDVAVGGNRRKQF